MIDIGFILSGIGISTIVLTALLAMFCLNQVGRFSVYTFCGAVSVYNVAGYYIPDDYAVLYYPFAALTNLFIVYILSKIEKPTKTTIVVQNWCVVFIINNLIGWAIFMLYYSPIAYTCLNVITYILMLLTIVKGHRDGNNNMDWNRSGFFRYFCDSCIAMYRNATTARLRKTLQR